MYIYIFFFKQTFKAASFVYKLDIWLESTSMWERRQLLLLGIDKRIQLYTCCFFFRGRWRQLSPKNSTHQQLCVVQECSVFKAFHYFSLAEFQDVNVMVILGFGFLWTFLVRYGFSGAGFNLLVAVVATQCAVILNGIDSWYYRGKIRINLRRWVTIESLLLLSPLFVLIQLRQLDLCNISI